MTNEEIIGMVQAKFPGIYPDDKVGILLGSLNKMSPLIKFGLEEYLKNGSNLDINLLGYSINELTTKHGMNPFAAYLTLDWIVRDPEKATASLKKGHDFVKPSNI